MARIHFNPSSPVPQLPSCCSQPPTHALQVKCSQGLLQTALRVQVPLTVQAPKAAGQAQRSGQGWCPGQVSRSRKLRLVHDSDICYAATTHLHPPLEASRCGTPCPAGRPTHNRTHPWCSATAPRVPAAEESVLVACRIAYTHSAYCRPVPSSSGTQSTDLASGLCSLTRHLSLTAAQPWGVARSPFHGWSD